MRSYDFYTSLSDCTFSVVDIETTGQMTNSVIVEVAAVKILPRFRIDLRNAYESLINPYMPINAASQAVHGITDEMVKNAPCEYEVMNSLSCFLGESIFVAHNASFDSGYLTEAFKAAKIKSPINYILDTLRIARKLLPKLKSHSLDSLTEYYSISSNLTGRSRHRALFDADITSILFLKQLAELDSLCISTIGDIYTFLGGTI